MVFSSIGDTTRKLSSSQNVEIARSGPSVARSVARWTASGTLAAAQGLFTALFPSNCRICGNPLTNISRLPVCHDCILSIRPLACPTCEICGEGLRDLNPAPGHAICAACEEEPPTFDRAVAFGAYDGELRELVHLLKYERVVPAAKALGRMLEQCMEKLRLDSPVLVVPIPLHASKRRQRGFNQAELIAKAALKKSQANATLETHLLKRVKATVSQIGLTRPQRRENIRGAFKVTHLNKVTGADILLVDDVLTTATTASEAARVLKRAGARHVWIATVARTLKGETGTHWQETEPALEASA